LSKEQDDDYDKYMRILDIIFRTSATILAIIFAYTLSVGRMPWELKIYVTILVAFLTGLIFASGLIILSGRRSELDTLKDQVKYCFLAMLILLFGMLALLLVAVYS